VLVAFAFALGLRLLLQALALRLLLVLRGFARGFVLGLALIALLSHIGAALALGG
jgi:hypothetical protein